jgi:hypothetical protein
MEDKGNRGPNSIAGRDGGFSNSIYETGSSVKLMPKRMILVSRPSSYSTREAEDYCQNTFGKDWKLYIPRSREDLQFAYQVAGDDTEYLRIFAIYPKFQGATCTFTALTSETCTTWKARDVGKFWVGTRTDIPEPNGDNCLNGSMAYWSYAADGTNPYYNDCAGRDCAANPTCDGYTSTKFICAIDE